MIDLDIIKDAVPDETLLKAVIESGTLSIIIDDSFDADGLETFIEAIILFATRNAVEYRFVFLGNRISDGTYRALVKRYGLADKTEYVYDGDEIRTLSNFLCSNVLFTRDSNADSVKLAKDLYLPVILTDKEAEEVVFNEEKKIFCIDETAEGIAAALMIINEKKYRDLFSGFRKVVREDI